MARITIKSSFYIYIFFTSISQPLTDLSDGELGFAILNYVLLLEEYFDIKLFKLWLLEIL